MDPDATWYIGSPQPMRHCVRWGPSCPPKGAQPPQFVAVYFGQTAACIRIPLGTDVGLSLGDTVLDGDPAPSPLKGHTPTKFLSHVYCGQTAGWMKTPLGTEVDLGPGHSVLDGDQAAPAKGAQQPPLLGPRLLGPRSPISATAELLLLEALCRSHTSGTPHVVAAGALT